MMKSPPSLRERIRSQLADLKMPGALEALDGILASADSGERSASTAIEALLGSQISLRNNRRLQAAIRSSRLPAVKTLRDFDFSFQPSVKREQLDSLHTLGFVERRENVIFLGPPGVGKTHLAVSLAVATAQSGKRIYYGTLADLIASLEEAETAGRKMRPCVVVSPNELNAHLGTFIVAPLTKGSHPYPFRVAVRFAGKDGHIVLDQVRTVDRERLAKRLGALTGPTLAKALAVLAAMFAP